MIRDVLSHEIEQMNEAIEWAQAGLKKAPEGKLLISSSRGEIGFYWRRSSKEKKGVYLGKKDDLLKQQLAQKDYETKLLKLASDKKKRLEKLLIACGGDDVLVGRHALASVYDQLSPARKALVQPYDLNDDDYAAQWMQREYESNGHHFAAEGLFSRAGVRVRSKSEVIIADLLEAANVPYRYEQALFIGGYSPVYPDFTVLNKRTRKEYVWEHLGAMDDPDYCHSAIQKLNRYALAGYLPGDTLIVTQETAANPLDTRVVQALIERFLK